jgi:Flp pilus assembly protein TadD
LSTCRQGFLFGIEPSWPYDKFKSGASGLRTFWNLEMNQPLVFPRVAQPSLCMDAAKGMPGVAATWRNNAAITRERMEMWVLAVFFAAVWLAVCCGEAPGALPTAQDEASQLASAAQAAMRAGQYPAAIEAFSKLVKMAPQVAELHADLGMAYYFSGRFADAAHEEQEALRLKSSLTHAHYFLGLSLAEDHQCLKALPYLEEDFKHITGLHLKREVGVNAVRCAMALNHPGRAIEFVRQMDRAYPNDPELLYLGSHVYSALAMRQALELLKADPDSYEAQQMNAEVLAQQGKYAEAAEEYRKVLALKPNLPDIHYQIGRLLLLEPRGPDTLKQAQEEFEKELAIDPKDAAAEFELGQMAFEARNWDEAVRRFRRATQIQPDDAPAWTGLGKSLIAAGNPQEAVAPLQKAVQLDPADPEVHYQLSFAFRRTGRSQDAAKELGIYRQTHEQMLETMRNIRNAMVGIMPGASPASAPN